MYSADSSRARLVQSLCISCESHLIEWTSHQCINSQKTGKSAHVLRTVQVNTQSRWCCGQRPVEKTSAMAAPWAAHVHSEPLAQSQSPFPGIPARTARPSHQVSSIDARARGRYYRAWYVTSCCAKSQICASGDKATEAWVISQFKHECFAGVSTFLVCFFLSLSALLVTL